MRYKGGNYPYSFLKRISRATTLGAQHRFGRLLGQLGRAILSALARNLVGSPSSEKAR